MNPLRAMQYALSSSGVTIMENQLKLGGNIDSWCGKCKLILAHTIEAMIGDKPARVHCNTCRSQHAYRPHAPGSSVRQTRQREGGQARVSPSPKARTARYHSLLRGKDTAAARVYSPRERYEPGDIVEHPVFGRGVATAVKDGTKVEVLFEGGSKTLIHGR
jgi:hypothetical protein